MCGEPGTSRLAFTSPTLVSGAPNRLRRSGAHERVTVTSRLHCSPAGPKTCFRIYFVLGRVFVRDQAEPVGPLVRLGSLTASWVTNETVPGFSQFYPGERKAPTPPSVRPSVHPDPGRTTPCPSAFSMARKPPGPYRDPLIASGCQF